MRTRHCADALLYTPDGRILCQDRTGVSKYGEKWQISWGGGIEEGETPEQAVRRELKEELDIDARPTAILGTFEMDVDRPDFDRIHATIFLLPCPDLSSMTVLEGGGMKLFTLPQARTLETTDIDYDILDAFEKWWDSR